jgi:epoxyqueuosine reductase QueG
VIDLATRLARQLADGGLDLYAAFPASAWDAAGPPAPLASQALLPGARTLVVAGSGGRALWERFTAWLAEAPRARLTDEAHPLDRYVATVLDGAAALFDGAGLRARRFEPTFLFEPRLDFRRLAELAGLGAPSPLGLLVHPVYGPWWGLRGAFLVAGALPATAPASIHGIPCNGCPAPCRAAIPAGTEGTIAAATVAAREACVLGAHRYSDEQIAYHYRPDEGRAQLLGRFTSRAPPGR